jgi:hypothetical protein
MSSRWPKPHNDNNRYEQKSGYGNKYPVDNIHERHMPKQAKKVNHP